MYVKHGSYIIHEDKKYTIDEFREYVNDKDTPLLQLIDKVNHEDRIEFVPKNIRPIVEFLRKGGC